MHNFSRVLYRSKLVYSFPFVNFLTIFYQIILIAVRQEVNTSDEHVIAHEQEFKTGFVRPFMKFA